MELGADVYDFSCHLHRRNSESLSELPPTSAGFINGRRKCTEEGGGKLVGIQSAGTRPSGDALVSNSAGKVVKVHSTRAREIDRTAARLYATEHALTAYART